MGDPTIAFLRNEAGETEGLADAGIETFRDAPYASCAREAGQNSRDAAEKLPVRLTFNVLSVPRGQIPGIQEVVRALEACALTADQEKEKEFFQIARSVASKATIPVLEIADYNTKGLSGPPDKPGTPFHALVKAAGVSKKDADTSGGSFGIGKNASFAVSDLQMVFYSTCHKSDDSPDELYAAQGKIKLVSHIDSANVARRATGYWGNPDRFQAITDTASIPGWMQRQSRGTSIFCVGFRHTEKWAERMAASLIANFFVAVQRGEMEFEVGNGEFLINQNTIEGLLSNEEVRNVAERASQLADLDFAGQLYRCLVSDNSTETVFDTPGLGVVRIRILVEAGLPRRVGFVRNGMLITDNLHHFGQQMQRFPGSRDFVALVEPVDESAGKLLKRLENPAHDNFSAERIADPVKRKDAEVAMRALAGKLREIIRENTASIQEESTAIDELARFFADAKSKKAPTDPAADHDPEKYVFNPPEVVVRPKAQNRSQRGSTGGGARGKKGGSGAGGTGPGQGKGTGGTGGLDQRNRITLADVRNVVRRDGNGRPVKRLLFFSSTYSGKARITIQATGVNSPETLTLVSTDQGTIDKGGLTLALDPSKRYSVTVDLAEPYEGPVELVVDGGRQEAEES